MKCLLTFLLTTFILFTAQAQDIFEVKFTAGITQYRCALAIFDDGTGKMRVRYYDNGTKLIEQSMRIEITQYGIRLTGYNPVYAGTTTRHPTYNADNFYISVDEYGNYTMVNIDDGGVTAKVFIRKVEGTRYTINSFLSDFNWKL